MNYFYKIPSEWTPGMLAQACNDHHERILGACPMGEACGCPFHGENTPCKIVTPKHWEQVLLSKEEGANAG